MPSAFADAPPWAAAFLSSPLAFAAALAVCLNMVLNIGVSKKARLTVQDIERRLKTSSVSLIAGVPLGARGRT